MRYEHLLSWILTEPWAIEAAKAREILAFLEARALSGAVGEDRAEKIHPSTERTLRDRDASIAIVTLHGVMAQRRLPGASTGGGASTEAVGRALDAAVADNDVKMIVLHVDSPGGAVAGTRELAAKVAAAKDRKPVITQVDSDAASAAYWVASQATEIVVTPGGNVGSVGIVAVHEDVSGMLEQAGIKKTVLTAGKYKAEGHSYGPLTEEARIFVQSRLDEAYRDFVSAVAAGRGVSAQVVEEKYGQGRVVSAKQALAAGMVDRIATFDETLARFSARKPVRDFSRQANAAMAIARS